MSAFYVFVNVRIFYDIFTRYNCICLHFNNYILSCKLYKTLMSYDIIVFYFINLNSFKTFDVGCGKKKFGEYYKFIFDNII